MNMSKRILKITVNCPHCKEAVDVIFTKKEIKKFYKSFKLPLKLANLRGERIILKKKA